jgi:NAD(P)-dependent dehydrogenase (short-subunit alcohol dehydrogenase family)
MTIALITGGSRGLGRSAALHLADRGADIILTYHSRTEEAAEVVAAIEAKGRRAAAIRLDVSKSAEFPAFADAVRSQLTTWGAERFDWLVNNAGVGANVPLAEVTEAVFDNLVAIHLKAPIFLTQALLPLMADGGRLLNVSSGLARFALPGYGPYAAMKGGVEVLTRYMAKEFGARGISANTIAPGAIETDFGGGHVRDMPDLNRFIASQTALGRVGKPDDIGAAVAAILSGDLAWMNAQRIEVSGGMFL